MEHREAMDMGKDEPKRPEASRTPESSASEELHHRADTLGDSLRSFEKEMDGADAMLAKMKDPAKREEFKSALAALRGRTGGLGNALRGAVAGLALFAGGVGIGRSMDQERHGAETAELARQAGAAEGENRILKEQLAKRETPASPTAGQGEKAMGRAVDALAGENAALRDQLADMAKDLARLRQERDEANARVIAEKEKGIVTQDALMKQQTVSGNLSTLYGKMKNLIEASGDPKLKEDADRFLAAYE